MIASPTSLQLHHVGFVVADITSSLAGFTQSLGATSDSRIYSDPGQKVRVAFLSTRPGDAQIELVEPAAEDSPVSQFLRKGGGLHHVCYQVADLDASIGAMKARGSILARRPKPAVAFGGRRITWLLTADKLLVELLEEKLTSR